jgi:ribonuclease HII
MSNFIDDFELICEKPSAMMIAGVDEAGRGPLCGPVVACAVIMPRGIIIEGVDDSKKLTEKKREMLFDIIVENAISYSISFVDNQTIDDINILNATMLAMEQAIKGLSMKPDMVLIDGNQNRGITANNKTIVKGDSKSHSIACASILAKVARDRFMLKIHHEYPQYGFIKHKGYGTKAHYEAILNYGVLPIYRKTFLKSILK